MYNTIINVTLSKMPKAFTCCFRKSAKTNSNPDAATITTYNDLQYRNKNNLSIPFNPFKYTTSDSISAHIAGSFDKLPTTFIKNEGGILHVYCGGIHKKAIRTY